VDPAIRLITPDDSIAELTVLIRRAYKTLADMGFNYTGAYQDEAMTRARIADGECYVMIQTLTGDSNFPAEENRGSPPPRIAFFT
jgi:hypothetical protein